MRGIYIVVGIAWAVTATLTLLGNYEPSTFMIVVAMVVTSVYCFSADVSNDD